MQCFENNGSIKNTKSIIKEILSKLDYSVVNLIERKEIIDIIYKEYGDAINNIYIYYSTSNLDDYINKEYMKSINNMFDKLSEYILCSTTNIPNKYSFSKTGEIKNSAGGKNIISLEYLTKVMLKSEQHNPIKYYNDYNNAKYSLKKIIKHLNECPYSKDYIDFNNAVRKIIETGISVNFKYINNEKKNIYRRIKDGQKISEKVVDNISVYSKLESELVNSDMIKFTDKELYHFKKAIGYTKNNSQEIDKDLIAISRAYFRFIYFVSPLKESTEIDWEQFDFTNANHVIELLRLCKGESFDSDLGCIVYDLNRLIEKCNLTQNEQEILELYKDHDLDNKTIAKELGYTPGYISQVVNKIANKITKKYWDEFEDWYYLNICRGQYKTCSQCGETKLIKYFDKHPGTKDGYYSSCKKCRQASNINKITK
jgi:DNA-binding CsgD family transcriptional regulator